jgi:hypothetical protein
MLSFEQLLIISKQLKKENAREFVTSLIMAYITDVNKASDLLEIIPEISKKQLSIIQSKVNDYYIATTLLLGERCRYPIQYRKNKKGKDYNPDFATLLYVCKAYFPNGNCDRGSQADKEFFAEFINTVSNKVGFDFNNKDDWEWICNVAQCRDWMISVIKQNIDSEFVEPEIEPCLFKR